MVIFRFSAFPCGLILPVLPNVVPRIPQKTNYLPDERKRFANEYLQCNIMLFASGGRICIMHLPKSFKNGKFVLKNCCIYLDYYLSFTNIHKRWHSLSIGTDKDQGLLLVFVHKTFYLDLNAFIIKVNTIPSRHIDPVQQSSSCLQKNKTGTYKIA